MKTTRHIAPLLLAVVALFALLVPFEARAQSQRSLTVLGFTSDGETGELTEDMYRVLRTQVEFHEAYRLNDVPPQTLDDLLLALGCSDLDAECASFIRETITTDMIAWGSITMKSNTWVIQLHLFDLESREKVRHTTNSLIGEPSLLTPLLPVFARGLLYGNVGVLTVTTSPEGAEVWVDDKLVGNAPIEVKDLPLGSRVVRVEAPGLSPRTERVTVDVTPATVNVRLSSGLAAIPVDGDSPTASWLPWVFVGTGAALLAAGTVTGLQTASSQQEFDRLVSRPTFDAGKAESLKSDGESSALLTNIFLGIGGASLATGVVMLLLDGDTESPAPSSVQLRPAFAPGGAAMDLIIRY